jgi:cytochrome c biogenesis protein CcdA
MLGELNPLLAFAAGVLSILSPCVLPLVPIVLGTAQSRHRLGPLALGAGLALTFTIVGLFVATIGFAIGLDGDVFRIFGGAMLFAFGIVLIAPGLQARMAMAGGPVTTWANQQMSRFDNAGLPGQAMLGVLLGLVWAPCVGPTLGAATLLASQGQNLGQVAVTMIAFGIGAATPLVVLGFASAGTMQKTRDRMRATGKSGKQLLGVSLVLIGGLILTGLDRTLETWLTELSPDWLVTLTTRY